MQGNKLSHTKRVLLTAFIGSENLGDEAICESLIQDLTKEHIEITAVSKNFEKTEKLGVHAVKLCSLGFIKALRNTDLVLLGGGGILQDQTSIYNIPYFISQIFLAQLLGKKAMFVAVGAGPIKGKMGKLLVSLSMKRINAITVRDTYSYSVLKNLGADEKKMHVVSDPAISLACNIMEKPHGIPDGLIQHDYIVVCLRHWFDLNRLLPVALSNRLKLSYRGRKFYHNFIATISECLDAIIEETTLSISFFPFYGKKDIKVNRDVYHAMNRKDRVFLIEESRYIRNFHYLVNHAALMISMRLHSAILSAGQYKPSIAISYSPKIEEFMKTIGMEEFVVDVNNINKNTMLHLTQRILSEKTQLSSHMKNKVARLQELNKKNLSIILNLLSRGASA